MCDECGFEAFDQATAERLAEFTTIDGDAESMATRLFKVYDFTNAHPVQPQTPTS